MKKYTVFIWAVICMLGLVGCGQKQTQVEEQKEQVNTDLSDEDVLGCYPADLGNAAALNDLEDVWGGSYMEEDGRWVVWLTENTQENQQKVFEQKPDLLENNTTFKTADYSLAYLTDLLSDISTETYAGNLPHVITAELREDVNRVEVIMTMDDSESMMKMLNFDTIGGAIEIQYVPDTDGVAYGLSVHLDGNRDVLYFPISFEECVRYGLVPDNAIGLNEDDIYQITEADLGDLIGVVADCEDETFNGCNVYHFAKYPEYDSICIVDTLDGYRFYTYD